MNDDLTGLNLVDLLDTLEPVPEPPPISMLPQTAGWIWLSLALLALAIWLVRRQVLRHRANAYRRVALARLERAKGDPTAIALIIRRTALSAYPRRLVAGLHGVDWLDFLDRSYGGNGFRQGSGRVLATAPYTPSKPTPDLETLTAEWIRRHRNDAAPS